jgi:hypothetical protein
MAPELEQWALEKNMTTAHDALIAYGYAQKEPSGRYVKPARRTQEWEPVEGGFLRYDPEGQVPFRGLTQDEADALNQERVKDGKPYLDLRNHNYRVADMRDLFIWVWPDADVARIYSGAKAEADAAAKAEAAEASTEE